MWRAVVFAVASSVRCVTLLWSPPAHTSRLATDQDMDVAREYDLDVTAQYFPLNIYTREVVYGDVGVQVGS